MANGKRVTEVVQTILESGEVPQSVSNRLLMAFNISEREERLKRDAEITEMIRVNHVAIFGDDKKHPKAPGLLEEQADIKKSLERYNRAVWIVLGALLTGGVGLLFGVF